MVNSNHSSENIRFRPLFSRAKYITRHSSNTSNLPPGMFINSTSVTITQSIDSSLKRLAGKCAFVREVLEKILNSCQNYELGEQLKLVKSEKKYIVSRSDAEIVEIPPLASVTPQQFLGLVTRNKESSLKVQDVLAEIDDSMVPLLESLILPNIAKLLHHRLGIYPLTKLIEKSTKIRVTVEKMAFENFKDLVVNEFGSKLLQKLASISDLFRVETLQVLFKNWSSLSENISSVFYLGYLMKIAPNKSEFTKVKDCILSQIDHQRPLRYNKRILVSFTRYCADGDLGFIFDLMKSRYLLQEVLNDVYFALCISILLTRNHQPTKTWILEQSTAKLYKLLKIRHFRSLCETVMLEMPEDFKFKFLLSIKRFVNESIQDQTSQEELAPPLCFALWLVLKHLGTESIREDSRFCAIVIRLFERQFSRRPLSSSRF